MKRLPDIKPEAVYFVVGDGNLPARLFFDALSAFESGHLHVGAFDKGGVLLTHYKRDLDTGRFVPDF